MPALVRLGDVCLSGDTLIRLMDGTSKRIDELVGLKDFYVYSIDLGDKKIVPGKVERVFKTGTFECIKITLDNNRSFTVTPDHKVMLRPGRMVKASTLKCNDSIMPLYTKIEDTGYNKKGYESVMHPNGVWQKTHRMVFDWKYGKDLIKGKLNTAHHKNFNSLDNNPTNICACTWSNHWKYHSTTQSKRVKEWTLEGKHPWQQKHVIEKSRISMRMNNPMSNPEIASRKVQAEIDKNGGIHPISIRNRLDNPAKNPQAMKKMVETRKSHPLGYQAGNAAASRPEVRLALSKKKCAINRGYSTWNDMIIDIAEKSKYKEFDIVLKELNLEKTVSRLVSSWKEQVLLDFPTNHKVISIENVGKLEVFDLTVTKTHNFALDCGVFVSNCTGHGCWPPRPNITASPDVATDSKFNHRVGDLWQIHCCDMSCHPGTQVTGSPTTFTNNKAQARIGDAIDCGSHNAQGSPDVFVDDNP